MAYISKLELRGFKSFNYKTTVNFDPNFTCITGKNGSGKSTIVDGILFVLGEMSTKLMRAERFTDLLFSGANGIKPAPFAEVSLYFNNSDGGLPVRSKEVVITRRVDRTGKCVYYINRKRASRQEIVEMLGSSTLSLGDYSFILQGEMDKIARMSPLERRQLLDEMAGVAEFEEKKAKALQELEKVTQNLLVRKARIEEIEGVLKELEEDVRKLRNFRELKEEYERISEWISGLEYVEYSSELSRVEKKVEKLLEEKKRLQEASRRLGEGIRQLSRKREGLEKELYEKQRLHASALERLRGRIEALEDQLLQYQQRKQHLEREISESPQQLVEFRRLVDEFKKLHSELKSIKDQEQLREKIEQIRGVLDRIEAALEQLEGVRIKSVPELEYRRVLEEMERLRGRLEEERMKLREAEERLDRSEVTRLERLREEVQSQLERLEERREKISERIAGIQNEITQLTEIKGRLLEKLNRARRVEVPRGLSLSKLEQRRAKIEEEMRKMGGEVNFRAEDQFRSKSKEYNLHLEEYRKLEEEKKKIEETILNIERRKKEAFFEVLERVNENFSKIFRSLKPEGEARLVLENPEDPFSGGLEVRVKITSGMPEMDIERLSGGERTLVTLAFIFALQRVKPSALYVFDEVDANLDPVNVQRVARLLREYSRDSQIIVVTLKDAVMAAANLVLGVVKSGGISQVYNLDLREMGEN